ncbi:MAG: acyl-CoA dehydrogenase family protein, partial [Acidobacteria bacterium]|nr:acyl-CoA dehydrogenase family protein [Acidobacteriota bacterium]
MSWEFTEEQEQIRAGVRAFAAGEIAPYVKEWDEAQSFPPDLIRKMADLGLLGIIFPEAYGGAGLGTVEYAIAIEEIARVDPSIALVWAAHTGLCANHIHRFGDEPQRRRFLPPLLRGEHLGAWALTEPESGSDAAAMKTTAVRSGAGWVLNGVKNFITNATHANTYVILAVTDRSLGNKGISAFVVERGTPGLKTGKKENKLGMRASDTASVVLDDCFLPEENLIGEKNRGFLDVLEVLDGGRITIAALAVGTAQGAFEAALKYASERHAFGQPISEFQAIRCKLADMATSIEAARLLTLRAARMRALNIRVTREASMAKLFASETSVRVSEEAIQIFGGYGYVKDYPPEKYWRDSKVLTIGEGTSEIQRMIIAREILR